MPQKKYVISNTKNKKALDEYIKNIKANGMEETTLYSHEINVRKILSSINKDYNKITEKDLDNTFSKIESTKKHLICFLKKG